MLDRESLSYSLTNIDSSICEKYATLWEESDTHPDVFLFLQDYPDASPLVQFQVLLFDQVKRWQMKLPCPLDLYFESFPKVAEETSFRRELLLAEWYWCRRTSTTEMINLQVQFPELRDFLKHRREDPAHQSQHRAGNQGDLEGSFVMKTENINKVSELAMSVFSRNANPSRVYLLM